MGIDVRERYIDPHTDSGFEEWFNTEQNKEIKKRLFEEQAETDQFTPDERRKYAESVKDYWDYYSTMKTAYKKGKAEGLAESRAEGRAKGRAEGLAKGYAEGLAEGKAKGRAEERIINARSLKENGIPMDIIIRSLNLTTEEIEQL